MINCNSEWRLQPEVKKIKYKMAKTIDSVIKKKYRKNFRRLCTAMARDELAKKIDRRKKKNVWDLIAKYDKKDNLEKTKKSYDEKSLVDYFADLFNERSRQSQSNK